MTSLYEEFKKPIFQEKRLVLAKIMEVKGAGEPFLYIRDIRLCTPDQDLGDDQNSFVTKPVEVESLGLVELSGDRNTQVEKQFPKAFTLLYGRLVRIPLGEYSQMGLYDAILGTNRNPHLPIICRIGTDENEDLVEGRLIFSDNEQVDPGGIVANWHMVGDKSDEEFPLLIPKDPKFLSELRFSFIEVSKLE